MNNEELADRLGSLEGEVKKLKKQVSVKNRQLQNLQDIEDIKRLQCAYGYYLERSMAQEIVDCFSDSPEVSGTFAEGTYLGKEGIRKYFKPGKEVSPEWFHMILQVSPVITVAPDGKRAKGRWYGYGNILAANTKPLNPMYASIIYEMEYIKEDGAWKILKLQLLMNYAYTQGGAPFANAPDVSKLVPDIWEERDLAYPSGYIYPFHYKHPVTGKVTSEAKRNAALKLKPSRYKPK
jgi:hypothetical protein